MSTQRYPELNGKYLREAEELIGKGDVVQASEKLWGAAAEMVKAVAAKRGRALGTHRSLWEFVYLLHEEYGDWNLMDGFRVAESLHVHFYEDHLPYPVFDETARKAREFMQRLRRLA